MYCSAFGAWYFLCFLGHATVSRGGGGLLAGGGEGGVYDNTGNAAPCPHPSIGGHAHHPASSAGQHRQRKCVGSQCCIRILAPDGDEPSHRHVSLLSAAADATVCSCRQSCPWPRDRRGVFAKKSILLQLCWAHQCKCERCPFWPHQ